MKHSKYKNTGIIFELLVRQVASDTMDNRKCKAMDILNKHFHKKSELYQELKLYRSLSEEKFKDNDRSQVFLEAVLKTRKSLNSATLKKEKFALVKSIRESYDLDTFFKARVTDYRTQASIYKLFEYTESDDPRGYVDTKFQIVEMIQNKPTEETDHLLMKEDKDTRILASKIIVDKFNEKYSNLSEGQKNLLRVYINSVDSTNTLKEFINNETLNLQNSLNTLKKSVSSKITRIKLTEAINLLGELKKKHLYEDKDLVSMLRFYELEHQLTEMIKK